ncbi:hypothetical protein ACFL27_06900 [candidate division CSSED10-310 bacterium]|uniref:Uncharacterized protein n=1 Tax=candidate division CSSED10-310 bacterium TaxID=2855610 RepID=A0ABV6YUP0_UNCC1
MPAKPDGMISETPRENSITPTTFRPRKKTDVARSQARKPVPDQKQKAENDLLKYRLQWKKQAYLKDARNVVEMMDYVNDLLQKMVSGYNERWIDELGQLRTFADNVVSKKEHFERSGLSATVEDENDDIERFIMKNLVTPPAEYDSLKLQLDHLRSVQLKLYDLVNEPDEWARDFNYKFRQLKTEYNRVRDKMESALEVMSKKN